MNTTNLFWCTLIAIYKTEGSRIMPRAIWQVGKATSYRTQKNLMRWCVARKKPTLSYLGKERTLSRVGSTVCKRKICVRSAGQSSRLIWQRGRKHTKRTCARGRLSTRLSLMSLWTWNQLNMMNLRIEDLGQDQKRETKEGNTLWLKKSDF